MSTAPAPQQRPACVTWASCVVHAAPAYPNPVLQVVKEDLEDDREHDEADHAQRQGQPVQVLPQREQRHATSRHGSAVSGRGGCDGCRRATLTNSRAATPTSTPPSCAQVAPARNAEADTAVSHHAVSLRTEAATWAHDKNYVHTDHTHEWHATDHREAAASASCGRLTRVSRRHDRFFLGLR